MPTYLVEKRMKEDRVYLPGEVLVDPDINVDVLRARGYLTIVPDGYPGSEPKAAKSKSKPKAEPPAVIDLSGV